MARKRKLRVSCKECKTKFVQSVTWHLFCSNKCRATWHAKEIDAGQELLRESRGESDPMEEFDEVLKD